MKYLKVTASIIIGALIGATLFGAPGILADHQPNNPLTNNQQHNQHNEMHNQHHSQHNEMHDQYNQHNQENYCFHYQNGINHPIHNYLNKDPNELTENQKQEILDHFNNYLNKNFQDINNLYSYLQTNHHHMFQQNHNHNQETQHTPGCW